MKRVFVRGEAETYANYDAALRGSGMEPVFSRNFADAESCDGLLLPGGFDIDPALYGQENVASVNIHPLRDKEELKLIRMFMAWERPILGICRGHQILNVALGGDMVQHIPDHYEVTPGLDGLHEVTAEHDFMRNLYGEKFVVNSAHHQIIGKLGQGLQVTCRSQEGYIEGVIHENGRVIGVQFHPERIGFAKRREEAVDGGALFEAFRKILEQTAAEYCL